VTLIVRSIVRAADAERAVAEGVFPVRGERVAALVSRREGSPTPTEQELRAHDAITRAVHDAAPSLPSRFGDVFVDEDAVAAALRAREVSLAADLDRVGERVELPVTLRWRTPSRRREPAAPVSGRAFLEGRAARERERQRAEHVVARLVEHLTCDRAFVHTRICPRDGLAAIVAILSTRDGVTALREDIASFGERSSEVVTEIAGPLPPFSFVS
jgi:hypothetical protein